MGDVPANYRCHKCQKPGHWIKNCPLNPPGGKDFHHHKTRPESNKKTGIPRSLRDGEAQEPTRNQFVEEKREIPEDLICSICKGIFKDAVMIPCCGSSFCDECVRTALLESDENECPDCKEKGTSPGSLIPNRFLRNAVAAFLAESSNSLSRNAAPEPEEEQATEEKVVEESVVADPPVEDISPNNTGDFQDFEHDAENDENESEVLVNQHPPAEKDSESDDDDNITVTVPPAHQQSRGAAFREPPRLRRIPSHNVGEHESYSQHSSSSKNAQEDSESFEDENESYNHRHHSSSKRGNHYEHSQSSHGQGISTLVGDDKSSTQNHYHSSSSSHGPSQNMPHGDSYQQQHQPPQHQPSMYNQNQHPGQHGMPPMHSHTLYPQQGPYHQPPGPYFPPNQMRYVTWFIHNKAK